MDSGEAGEEVQLLEFLREDVLRGHGGGEGAGKAENRGAQSKMGPEKDEGVRG